MPETLLKEAPPKLAVVRGEVLFAQLREPNMFGDYTLRLLVSVAEAQELVKLIDEEIATLCAQSVEGVQRAPLPYAQEADGVLTFRFKLKARTWTEKHMKDQRPRVLDGQGKPLPTRTFISAGSEVKVRAELVPYHMKKVGVGVSLRLRAVKVLKLVKWTPDAAYFGLTASR